jgi:DUF1365 family protein
MSDAALYVGRVRHRRLGDPVHEFSYPVWYALADVDRLPRLAHRTRGFAHNGLGLTSFDDRDHFGRTREPVRDKIERWLAARGVADPPPRLEVLCHLRVLGSVFNPISFFFCRGDGGRARQVVVEVNNTFGEAFCYLLEASNGSVRNEADKAFHVSPFQPLEGRYRFRITDPGRRFAAHIDLMRDGARVFDSTLSLERRQWSSAELVRTVLRWPHVGWRTLALIHAQALRLWARGAPFHRKPEMPRGAWRTRGG